MRVELALLFNDELLSRGKLSIKSFEQTDDFGVFKASHKLLERSAIIVLSDFAEGVKLHKSALEIPIHESGDWESIDLAGYILAFRCRLDA